MNGTGGTRGPLDTTEASQARKFAAVLAAISAAALAMDAAQPYVDKTPMHNSILFGELWVQEILNGRCIWGL